MNKPIWDWGQAQLAPSVERVRPGGWIAASCVAGVAAGTFALMAAWRPLPGLPLPAGMLSEHAGYWSRVAVHALAPSFFAESARSYAAHVASLPGPERVGMIWRCALAAWAAAMPSMLLAGPMLRPRDGVMHIRGASRHSGADAKARLNGLLGSQARRRPDHDVAPGVPFPADLWTRHLLVVGGVGSGKSTAIKPLIDKVVKAGEQMLIFDPKSEFTSGFAGPALLAPWDERSLAWDVARDMRNILDMRRFAACMVRDSADPMWSNAARQLLVGLMARLKGTRGTDWGWGDLRDLVALPQSELLPIMKRWHPEAVRAVEKASVTTAGILINLSAFCSSIFDLAKAWGAVPAERRISFVEWTLGRSKFPQVVLQGHGAYSELTKSYVEGIVGIVSAIVNSVEMRDDPNRKIWFIADEFAQMGKIPVRALFEVGRSRGVRCVVACQDFAQLEELYGPAMVKALIGMCGSILVGQMMPGETAEQLCKAFGSREVERMNVSMGPGRSSTSSFGREEVPLYKPSELASRLGLSPDGKGVTLILFTGGQAYELFWPHYRVREERPGHVPAPWLESVPPAVPDDGDGAEADGRRQDRDRDPAIDLSADQASGRAPSTPDATESVADSPTDAGRTVHEGGAATPDLASASPSEGEAGISVAALKAQFHGVCAQPDDGTAAGQGGRHDASLASPSLSAARESAEARAGAAAPPPKSPCRQEPKQRPSPPVWPMEGSSARVVEEAVPLAELEAIFGGFDASGLDPLDGSEMDGCRFDAEELDPLCEAVLDSSLHAAGMEGLSSAALLGQAADALFGGGAGDAGLRRGAAARSVRGTRRHPGGDFDTERREL